MLPFVDAKHPTCTSNWIRDFILKSSTSEHGLENTDLAHPKSMVQCRNSLMVGWLETTALPVHSKWFI